MYRAGAAVMALVLVGLVAAASGQGRKVSGTVVDAVSEQAVAGTRVEYEEDGVVQATRTDEKGYFEFGQGGLGVVTVRASDFGTAYARWPPQWGSSLRIHLRAPRTVTGAVIDMATRRAISQAVVNVLLRSVNDNILSDTAITSGGSFTFDDLPAASGRVVYLARAEGFAPRVGDFALRDRGATNVQIGLFLDAVVEGTVLDASGSPVGGAAIEVKYSDDTEGGGLLAGLIGGQVQSGQDGVFRLEGVAPDHEVTLQAVLDDGRRSDTVTVTVGPGMMWTGLVLVVP